MPGVEGAGRRQAAGFLRLETVQAVRGAQKGKELEFQPQKGLGDIWQREESQTATAGQGKLRKVGEQEAV